MLVDHYLSLSVEKGLELLSRLLAEQERYVIMRETTPQDLSHLLPVDVDETPEVRKSLSGKAKRSDQLIAQGWGYQNQFGSA